MHHLLWRMGFGPKAEDRANLSGLSNEALWARLKKASAAEPEYFDVASNAVKGLLMGLGEAGKIERGDLSKAEKKKVREQSREDSKSLNLRWLNEMVDSKAQLREKMALFWHGHFATRNLNVLYQQQLLHVIRRHALGNFGAMLREVSKSAGMLAFLNNQQNKKQHPNENFAREVMELFTLGRGNYTEDDIKEAARAFTGWGFQLDGTFVFRKRDHDNGYKTIFGRTNHYDGDEVLDLLLGKRETARFITRKLYRFLVNEQKAPEDRIEWLAGRFYDSGYDILALLDDIAGSEWFYAPENTGVKIKSPVELWVGIRRVLPLQLEDPEAQLVVQKILGQILLNPPNVAGWPGGKNWIDSSSLMLRLRLPQILADNGDFEVQGKDDDDVMMGQKGGRKLNKRLEARVDWQPVLKAFGNIPDEKLLHELCGFFWQSSGIKPPYEVLKRYTDSSTPQRRIQSTLIQLMSTPEYQLC